MFAPSRPLSLQAQVSPPDPDILTILMARRGTVSPETGSSCQTLLPVPLPPLPCPTRLSWTLLSPATKTHAARTWALGTGECSSTVSPSSAPGAAQPSSPIVKEARFSYIQVSG